MYPNAGVICIRLPAMVKNSSHTRKEIRSTPSEESLRVSSLRGRSHEGNKCSAIKGPALPPTCITIYRAPGCCAFYRGTFITTPSDARFNVKKKKKKENSIARRNDETDPRANGSKLRIPGR